MQRITTVDELKKEILLLEIKQASQAALLKDQLHVTYESLKPSNLIRNTLSDIINTPDLKNGILTSVASLAAGYISKKVAVGNSDSPVRKILGTVLQFFVTKAVSNKAEDMQAARKEQEEEEKVEKEPTFKYTSD